MKFDEIVPVQYVDDTMLILDQTRLPGEEVYIGMETDIVPVYRSGVSPLYFMKLQA